MDSAASQVAALQRALDPSGLDLVAPLRVQDYNRAAPSHTAPTLGRHDTLGIIIGNTRALWPRFLASYHAGELGPGPDPLDRYCAAAIANALHTVANVHAEPYFAPEPPPRRMLLQQAAVAAGLAYLAPSHLCVHPRYGPWISLRALVILDAPSDLPADTRPPAAAPCAHCATGCDPLARALGAPSRDGLARTWRDYLALRDACPRGREHRFSEAQLRYHYTHDRTALSAPARPTDVGLVPHLDERS